MGAPEELVAFVGREHPRLVRAVSLLLDDRSVAEEVAQEALLRAASRWETVRGLDAPGAWVHRVAINLATSQLRRRQLERRARHRVAREEVAPAPDTAEALVIREAMHRLAPEQRRVLVLRYVLGWTAEEIGGLDGATGEAVRQRLQRARAALRNHLDLTVLDVEETSDAR
jgi:RNA polymerase sigma factor (sigma-70 family)